MMAMHDDLPVYKAAYDLLLEILQVVGHFQREYRYTVGDRLKNEAVEVLMLIQDANMLPDRASVLQDARRRVGAIRLLLRVANDSRQLGLKHFVAVSMKVEAISRQLAGWQKSSLKQI